MLKSQIQQLRADNDQLKSEKVLVNMFLLDSEFILLIEKFLEELYNFIYTYFFYLIRYICHYVLGVLKERIVKNINKS